MADGNGAAGSPRDARALLDSVYDELRRLARQQMAGEAQPATLQPTALVHETWLRLAREGRATWENRSQFFVAAATAMRRILVERARARRRLKRGGAHGRVAWNEDELAEMAAGASSEPKGADADTLLELDEALEALRGFDARLAQIVELRVFAGMTEVEAGTVLGLSARSVRRDWRAARIWLWQRMQRGGAAEGSVSGAR
jgi:RNA polymerase sigma factor (TIGR02999 family)